MPSPTYQCTKRSLGVHQIELVIQSSPGLGDGCRVGEHTDGSLYLGEISTRHDCGRLVVDPDLETSGTPVDELDGPLGFDGSDGRVDVFRDHIASVEDTAGHVFAVAWVAFDHLVGRLEAGVRDLGHRQLFVVGLLGRYHWSVSDQREMNTRIRYQVGLELCQIHVQGAIETQGRSDGTDDLTDKSV